MRIWIHDLEFCFHGESGQSMDAKRTKSFSHERHRRHVRFNRRFGNDSDGSVLWKMSECISMSQLAVAQCLPNMFSAQQQSLMWMRRRCRKKWWPMSRAAKHELFYQIAPWPLLTWWRMLGFTARQNRVNEVVTLFLSASSRLGISFVENDLMRIRCNCGHFRPTPKLFGHVSRLAWPGANLIFILQ